ncbi:MAG TPA: acyl-CoA thioesterase [Acidimicrobiia bacterium]|nr:acyl-CoA thioesterase [Acidimicrobiia bacterium]
MEGKTPAESASTVTLVMQLIHANSAGFIHGGEIMKLVDTTAGVASMRHGNSRVVTVEVDSLTFLAPVHIGDLVTLEAVVTQAWRTSMEVEVRVKREDPRTGDQEQTTTAYLTMVAVDENGRPARVPEVLAETQDDIRRQREANVRREERIRVRERLASEA